MYAPLMYILKRSDVLAAIYTREKIILFENNQLVLVCLSWLFL